MLQPETDEDFDSQLQLSISELNNLKSIMKKEIVFMFCSEDFKENHSKKIHPDMIKEKLENFGFRMLELILIFCFLIKNLQNFSSFMFFVFLLFKKKKKKIGCSSMKIRERILRKQF